MNNEYEIMISFPLWLNVILALIGLHILLMTIKYSSRRAIIGSFKNLPNENKMKLMNIYSQWLKVLKFTLWLIPINLVITPYVFYLYVPEYFFHITVLMSAIYLSIIINYISRRAFLNGFET